MKLLIKTIGVKEVSINFPAILETARSATKTTEKTVSLTLTNNRGIRKLNKKFRNKDVETNVLSFPYEDPSFPGSKDMLGEIIISVEQAKKQSKQEKTSLKNELIKLFIHGYLHLCGYTHNSGDDYKKMEKMAEKIVKKKDIR